MNDNYFDEEEYDAFKIDIKDLTIYVNNYCNKRCRGCYVVPEKKDIDSRWIQWCVENFKIGKVIVIGGEPSVSPVLPKVLQILKEKKITDDLLITASDNQ